MIGEVIQRKMASLKLCLQRLFADLYFDFGLQPFKVRRNFVATDDLAQERVVGWLALRNNDAVVEMVPLLLKREHNVDEQLANHLVLLFHGHHIAPLRLDLVFALDDFLSVDPYESHAFSSVIEIHEKVGSLLFVLR